MEIRQLRYFLEIARCGSFSKAAKTLYISQPALTRSINVLEDHLQNQLFERTPRGVNLTSEGEILVRHASKVMNQLESASRELTAAHEGEIGNVKVGIASLFSNLILDQAVASFTRNNPRVRVTIRVELYETLAHQLETGLLDFALSANPDSDHASELDFEPIDEISSYIVAAPSNPIFNKKCVSLDDLLDSTWVMLEQPHMDSFMHFFFASEDLPSPRSSVNTNSLQLLRSLLRTGEYIGFLPKHWMQEDLDAGNLRIVDAPSTPIQRKVGIVTHKNAIGNEVANLLMKEVRKIDQFAS